MESKSYLYVPPDADGRVIMQLQEQLAAAVAERDALKDAVALISETINQVRKGQVDPRVANAVGYLANVLIKAVEQGELESRLAEVEAAIKGQRPSSDLAMTGTDS